MDIIVSRPSDMPAKVEQNYELDKQHNRLDAARAMENATHAGNKNKLYKARRFLHNSIKRIQGSISAKDKFCQRYFRDDVTW